MRLAGWVWLLKLSIGLWEILNCFLSNQPCQTARPNAASAMSIGAQTVTILSTQSGEAELACKEKLLPRAITEPMCTNVTYLKLTRFAIVAGPTLQGIVATQRATPLSPVEQHCVLHLNGQPNLGELLRRAFRPPLSTKRQRQASETVSLDPGGGQKS